MSMMDRPLFGMRLPFLQDDLYTVRAAPVGRLFYQIDQSAKQSRGRQVVRSRGSSVAEHGSLRWTSDQSRASIGGVVDEECP